MDTLLRRRERHIRAEADLHNLQTELDAIPTGEKVAYLLAIGPDRPCRAEATGRSAQGRNRHMAYLEGCNFDARAAARKIVQYWAERLELFGPTKAFERMSLHGVSTIYVWMERKIRKKIETGKQTLLCLRFANANSFLYNPGIFSHYPHRP